VITVWREEVSCFHLHQNNRQPKVKVVVDVVAVAPSLLSEIRSIYRFNSTFTTLKVPKNENNQPCQIVI